MRNPTDNSPVKSTPITASAPRTAADVGKIPPATNNGKPWRTDEIYRHHEQDVTVLDDWLESNRNSTQRRRSTDRASAEVIARRLLILALVFTVALGVAYGVFG